MEKKNVLDACCGGRMFWFDKKDPRAMFIDNRTMEPTLFSNGATLAVTPDILMDFRKMEFPDESFGLVVFDPPHVRNAGEKSFLAKKYGFLNKDTWQEDLRLVFSECFRVLKSGGTLIFKWNECHIPLKEILALTPERPLFGNRGGKAAKTHWVVFNKQ
jgi:hypothetical protein